MEKINISKRIPLEFIVFLFLLALCFILYTPSLKADFVLDDNVVVAQNPAIKQAGLYRYIFAKSFFSPYKSSADLKLGYYRPMTLSSLALDYRIWGLRPWGYRLTNIFLHALNGILLFLLVRRIFQKEGAAFLSAVLFCILPVHGVTVNTISCRGDLLQAFFLLMASITFVGYLGQRIRGKLFLSILFFICAILSRETSLVYPLLAILLSWNHDRDMKAAVRKSLPFFAVAVLYYIVRLALFPIASEGLSAFLSADRLLRWFLIIEEYSVCFIFPWSAQTATKILFAPVGLKSLIFLLGVIVLIAGIFLERKKQLRKSQLIFGLIWIFVTMLPFLVMEKLIERMGPYFSEAYLYLSSVGFVIVLGSIILNLNRTFRYGILIFLVSYYVLFSIYNNYSWDSEKNILDRVFRIEQSYAHIAGMQLLMKYEDNERETRKIIDAQGNPASRSMWVKRLGGIYRHRKDYPGAIPLFKEAIRLNPGNIEAYNELAVAYFEAGDVDNGIRYLRESLLRDGEYAETYRILGQVLYQKNDYAGAAGNLSKAYYYNPDDMETLLYLAMANFFNKQDDQYAKWMDVLIRKFGNTRLIVRFVVHELYNHGYFRNAARLIEDSQEYFTDDARMFMILSRAYFYMGQEQKATDAWKKARMMKSFASVAGNP
ncbi:MAG TPA: tetratricopeptide repeat protein [Candidatus Omnitrophota bacterium]|nr:tetratricopeptide repeat protein [Candidatus Omnitrophota bacterium]HPD84406.1 tetratricopeptide repeat protein [Candidatus Omnitrophota bacterium]HRZ03264.1 tetratricopeptide repeat protein [Candidatus Omnitrophota bacterium]